MKLFLACLLLLSGCAHSPIPGIDNREQPKALSPSGSTTWVKFGWTASSTPGVTYKAYLGTASRHYTRTNQAGTATNYTFSGLSKGVVYYLTVTAVNRSVAESPYSNEVTYRTPKH